MTLQALKRAVIDAPDDAEPRFALAEALFAATDLAGAEKQLTRALELHPLHANAQRLLARVYEAMGRDPGKADALPLSSRERAKRAEAAHRLDDAIMYGELAARDAQTDAPLWAEVAQWCRKKQLFDRARLAFGQALRISQGQASVLQSRDALLTQLGEDDSLDLLSEVPAGALVEAVEALVLGDVSAVKRALATASPREKEHAFADYLRGELKRASGDAAGAEAAFAKGHSKDARPYVDGRLAKRITFTAFGRIGVLGWSPVGGAVSPMEAVAVPGRGILQFTGNVGETGKEAGLIAFTCLKALAGTLGIDGLITTYDLHLHFTDIEFGKEGLSSGLALTLAGLSAYRRKPLMPRLGATGSITTSGEVQRVEGIYEKFVAAWLAGLRRILYPRGNSADVKALPAAVIRGLETIPVSSLDEALKHAFA